MCLVCCRPRCTPWFLSPGLKYALLHRLCRFCCATRAPALGNFLAPDERHRLQQDLSEAWAGRSPPGSSSRLGATLWGLSALLSGVLCLMDQPASPVRCLSPVWRSTLQNAACHPDLLAQSEATSADLTAQSPKAFGKKGSGLHTRTPPESEDVGVCGNAWRSHDGFSFSLLRAPPWVNQYPCVPQTSTRKLSRWLWPNPKEHKMAGAYAFQTQVPGPADLHGHLHPSR
ncbi:uncharacterized protein LOC117083379 isoform X2 [Trachypithecus francoisi]|uniref:uncharacterized protein LOC117083379 isoform X2 n=1 Tax=Trachypithecus francoisi TaxID=54180 RepID=UPI00141AFA52|nr:uncharacterized protein LOC117083379 isoform X2 [Trachypithecus francoisi]